MGAEKLRIGQLVGVVEELYFSVAFAEEFPVGFAQHILLMIFSN